MRRLVCRRSLARLRQAAIHSRCMTTAAATTTITDRPRIDPYARPVRCSQRQRLDTTPLPIPTTLRTEEEKDPEPQPQPPTTAATLTDSPLSLSNIPLVPQLAAALRSRLHINSLTPVQAAVLPHALARSHIVARSHTGSGKTLAFLLPLLNHLLTNAAHSTPAPFTTRILILQPTRELTLQTLTTLQSLISALPQSHPIVATAVYGGAPFPAQERAVAAGVHILCATPGRLLDLMARRAVSVKRVEVVVLDECDEMLRAGFVDDVETILSEMPTATAARTSSRQMMMFSATTPAWLRRISKRYMQAGEVAWLDLTDAAERPVAAASIRHQCMVAPVDWSERASVIAQLVQHSTGRVLVFLPSQHNCTVLASHPALSSLCLPLHGGLTQARREEVMSAFRGDRIHCLLTTDVLARGVDLPLELVVHAYMPEDAEGYVHRSGRTGRAGRQGRCVLLYSAKERPMVRVLGQKLGVEFEEVASAALTSALPVENVAELTETEIVARMTATLETAGAIPATSPYLAAARSLLDQHGPLVLATLMQSLWSTSQQPLNRSILTGLPNYTCLHIKGNALTKDSVTQQLISWLQQANSGAPSTSELRVGRMDFIVDGALVDVDVQSAGVLLSRRSESEVDRCEVLPVELWDEKRSAAAVQFQAAVGEWSDQVRSSTREQE